MRNHLRVILDCEDSGSLHSLDHKKCTEFSLCTYRARIRVKFIWVRWKSIVLVCFKLSFNDSYSEFCSSIISVSWQQVSPSSSISKRRTVNALHPLCHDQSALVPDSSLQLHPVLQSLLVLALDLANLRHISWRIIDHSLVQAPDSQQQLPISMLVHLLLHL